MTAPISGTTPRTRARRWLVLPALLLAVLAGALVACSAGDSAESDTASTEPGVASGRDTFTTGDDGGKAVDTPYYSGESSQAGGAPAPSDASTVGAAGGKEGVAGTGQSGAGNIDFGGRSIIRSGSVSLTVDSVGTAFTDVEQLAEGLGGFVASSEFRGSGEDQSASLSMRIPAEQFGTAIARLRDLAVEVRNVSSSSQDVTEEFSDLHASLRNLQAVEATYLTLLDQAETISDILTVQDRLSSVRFEIERIQGRLNVLGDLTDFATINVSLLPVSAALERPVDSEPTFQSRVADAWHNSLDALEGLATGLAVLLVWSWWLIPLVIALVVIGVRLARRLLPQPAPDLRPEAPRVDTPGSAA